MHFAAGRVLKLSENWQPGFPIDWLGYAKALLTLESFDKDYRSVGANYFLSNIASASIHQA